jgi:hypothetical protein
VRFVGAPLWDSDALRAAMRGHGVAMCVGACPKDDDYIRISEAIIAAAIDELSEPSRLWFLSSPAVLELPSHNYIRAAEVPGVATERNVSHHAIAMKAAPRDSVCLILYGACNDVCSRWCRALFSWMAFVPVVHTESLLLYANALCVVIGCVRPL